MGSEPSKEVSADNDKLHLVIKYCNDCGHRQYYEDFTQKLAQQPYGNRINVEGRPIAGKTARFDVMIKSTKQKIYTNQDGHGWPKNPLKLAALNKKLRSALHQLDDRGGSGCKKQ